MELNVFLQGHHRTECVSTVNGSNEELLDGDQITLQFKQLYNIARGVFFTCLNSFKFMEVCTQHQAIQNR